MRFNLRALAIFFAQRATTRTRMAMQNLNENLANDLLWGAQAIGDAIGVNRRRAFFLLTNGRLPARQIGKRWVASRAALHAYLASVPPASEKTAEA